MTDMPFQETVSDGDTAARAGVLSLPKVKIKTPVLWLGHSIKDSVKLSSSGHAKHPAVLVNAYEILNRRRVLSAVRSDGIHEYLGHSGPVMMDSGGFLFQKRNDMSVTPLEVAELYKQSGADIGVALDHPLMPNAHARVNRQRWRRSLRNLELMASNLPASVFMPVIHGYTLPTLREACRQVRAVFREPAMVGVGSLVPLIKSSHIGAGLSYRRSAGGQGDHLTYIADAIKLIREEFPHSFLHVFGVGGITTVLCVFAFGADSADSVAWRIKAAYGAIQLPGLSDRFLSPRPDSSKTRRILDKGEEHLLGCCRCPACSEHSDIGARRRNLDACFRARSIHNGWVLGEEVKAFHVAVQTRRVASFMAGRVARSHRLHRVLHAAPVGKLLGLDRPRKTGK